MREKQEIRSVLNKGNIANWEKKIRRGGVSAETVKLWENKRKEIPSFTS